MTMSSHLPAAPTSLTLRPTSRGKIIGNNEVLARLVGDIDRVARASCTVLITGESGTGKEMMVAALHDASPRAGRPLVTMNCGAVPDALLESELFGHVKGAFTGAHASRTGRVAAAEGGTLFLDEIGELPLSLQVKLLRLLQQREYSPVGETRTFPCDVRIVAATNRDLAAEVRAGRFREDLYYRLAVIHFHVPALRERRSDVPALAKHFFRRFAAELGREDLDGFSDEALETMRRYDWPGNVRELENSIERAILLAAGPRIEASDLPAVVRTGGGAARVPDGVPLELPREGIDLRAALEHIESCLVRQALARTSGNKNQAAQLLGLNRTTLVEMVKRKQLAS
jgi:sigma-54 specific flagellar transcriptional regulator A